MLKKSVYNKSGNHLTVYKITVERMFFNRSPEPLTQAIMTKNKPENFNRKKYDR